nr:Putative DNA-binding protein [Kibdelosporangium sp. MJ126-NF4]
MAHSTIGRWENGEIMPSTSDVEVLLDLLKIDKADRDKIMALAQDSAEKAWLVSGSRPPGISRALSEILECERTARHITYWSPMVIPGVLQTSDYARSIFDQSTMSPSEIQTLVTLRMGRRDVFMRADPAELVVLIGEPAIHGGIGGPKTMRDQLRHLLAMSKHDAINLQVVRLNGEWHPGLSGPFVMYKFPIQPAIVHFEHHRSGGFLVDQEDIAAYESAVDAIRRHAMSIEETTDHIAEVLTALEAP